jgi:D-alanyl-D-alanine carboxypeptidase (penicillin-binding protein 5/6)
MRALLLALLACLALAAPAAAAPPPISAPSAIVVDASDGHVLYAKSPDARLPIASTTKLMTVLLALENAKLTDLVTAPRYVAAPAESVIGLQKGERMTVADLIRAAMVYSANDAAWALGAAVGGSESSFVREMNRRAQQLGLTNTHYANPIGLDDPQNYSSARDLAKLTIALRRFPFFRATVNRTFVTLKSGLHPRTLRNRNLLVQEYPWVDGVKTGHTNAAGNILVASGRQRGASLIAVEIGNPSKVAAASDCKALLLYGFGHYVFRQLIGRNQTVPPGVPIKYRPGAELMLVAGRTIHKGLLKGTHLTRVQRGVPRQVDGPIQEGQRFGSVDIMAGGHRLATVPLEAASDVPAASAARRLQDTATKPVWLLVLVAGIAIVALVVRRLRPAGSGTLEDPA